MKNFKFSNIILVEDVRMFPSIKTMPLINEEVYVKEVLN